MESTNFHITFSACVEVSSTLKGSFRPVRCPRPAFAMGRNDSLANGSLRALNFQCQLSGDECEGSAVAIRPEAVDRERRLLAALHSKEDVPVNGSDRATKRLSQAARSQAFWPDARTFGHQTLRRCRTSCSLNDEAHLQIRSPSRSWRAPARLHPCLRR